MNPFLRSTVLTITCLLAACGSPESKIKKDHIDYVKGKLKDPDSIKIISQKIELAGTAGHIDSDVPEATKSYKIYCSTVHYNARNSYGGYAGEDLDLAQYAELSTTHEVIRIDEFVAEYIFKSPDISAKGFMQCQHNYLECLGKHGNC